MADVAVNDRNKAGNVSRRFSMAAGLDVAQEATISAKVTKSESSSSSEPAELEGVSSQVTFPNK